MNLLEGGKEGKGGWGERVGRVRRERVGRGRGGERGGEGRDDGYTYCSLAIQ